MPPGMRSNKTIWIVAAAAIVAILLLIVLFTALSTSDNQDRIVLPTTSVDSTNENADESEEGALNSDFVVINSENVAAVLQTLNRPAAYRQSYTVAVGPDGAQRTKTVDLWVNDDLLHAEVTDNQLKKTIITDGHTVYLWYNDNKPHISLELSESITVADVLGLPDFDSYLRIPQDSVVSTEYLLLEEPQIQCIYVCAEEDSGVQLHYWVNLENGLLYKTNAIENEKTVYTMLQTGFDLLATEDEIFSDRFILPDGTAPFTVKTE